MFVSGCLYQLSDKQKKQWDNKHTKKFVFVVPVEQQVVYLI